MSEIICKRNFGPTCIQINKAGAISIIGMHISNYGLIYPNQISRFKANLSCNIIGMDYQPAKTHIAYIHGRILAGLFDHLIPTKPTS